MLKIGSVKWKGRCGKHPSYNPGEDGEGGIKGGCARCGLLLDIFHHHTKVVRGMREFGSAERTGKARPQEETAARQGLFEF
jgi:hypothetical protein